MKQAWVWQRGPWLMIDRISGHVTALKLPDYDPGVSQVCWFPRLWGVQRAGRPAAKASNACRRS